MKRTVKTTVSAIGYYLNLWHLLYYLYPIFRKKYILSAVTFHRILPRENARHYVVDYDIGQDKGQYETILEELSGYFDFIDLDHFIKYVSGEDKLHRHSMLITFDDADSTFIDHAFPILARNNWPATVFAPTKYIETDERFWHLRISSMMKNMDADTWRRIYQNRSQFSPELQEIINRHPAWQENECRPICRDIVDCLDRLSDQKITEIVNKFDMLGSGPYNLDIRCMSWDEMRMIEKHNIAIESHSVSHAKFKYLSPATITAELKESKTKIESALDKNVRAFCYPAGSYDHDISKLVQAAGYRVAFTTQTGLCDYPTSPDRMFRIPRISFDGSSRSEINFLIGQLLFNKSLYNSAVVSLATLGLIIVISLLSLFLVN